MANYSRVLSTLGVVLLAATITTTLAQNAPPAPGMAAPTQPTVKCKKQNGCPKKQQKKAQKQAQKQAKQAQKQSVPSNTMPHPAPSMPT